MSTDFFTINKKSKSEVLKLEKQKTCICDYWITKCSKCNKILGSDSIRHIESTESFINNNYACGTTEVLVEKKNYNYEAIYLEKEQETNLKVASYTFEDIQVLQGQVKIYFSLPFANISKQCIINAGERLRFKNNQSFHMKAIKNGATIAILKTNI